MADETKVDSSNSLDSSMKMCPLCDLEKDLSGGFKTIEDDRPICETCYQYHYVECNDCHDIISRNDDWRVYSERGELLSVCGNCFEDSYYTCNHCGRALAVDIMDEDLEDNWYCHSCRIDGHGVFTEEQREPDLNRKPKLDIEVKTFQDENKGTIIKDTRAFSAEIECYFPKPDNYYAVVQEINTRFIGTGQVGDASLDGQGIEIQTPILKGKMGESYMKDLSSLLIKQGFYVNMKAGLHIHLDGKGFTKESLYSEEETLEHELNFFFNLNKKSVEFLAIRDTMLEYTRSRHLLTDNSDTAILHRLLHQEEYMWYPESRREDMKELDKKYLKNKKDLKPEEIKIKVQDILKKYKRLLTDKELEAYRKYISDCLSSKLLQKLRQLFIVYYFADEFIMQLLPHSRRNNKYCLPLWREFNIHKIDSLQTINEFEQMWYMNDDLHYIQSRKGNPKDNSRRHGANFHILMCQGHFEIRYHSGTISADKILYWVQLNQALMDLADTVDYDRFNEIRNALEEMKNTQNLKLKRRMMYGLLNLSNEAIAYWENRAMKFTDEDELKPHPENDYKKNNLDL